MASERIEQIRQWEAGSLYPEHDTFSFGHGFGSALVAQHDEAAAILQKAIDWWTSAFLPGDEETWVRQARDWLDES